MKRLITICAVVGLMLSLTCVSWANLVKPTVNHPPGDDPTWWNTQCPYYAYGWWEADLTPGSGVASPPNDGTHWATNFLGSNTAFTASIPGPDSTGTTVSINLNNVYRKDYYKEIYIYLRGTTTAGPGETISGIPDTDGGTFSGEGTFGIGSGEWHYKLIGEIIPQPNWVNLMVTVPGLTSVTDIWAGENCIPEPATISLLGLGVLSLLRRKRSV